MKMKDQTDDSQNGLQANEIEAKNKVTIIVKPRATGDGEPGKTISPAIQRQMIH